MNWLITTIWLIGIHFVFSPFSYAFAQNLEMKASSLERQINTLEREEAFLNKKLQATRTELDSLVKRLEIINLELIRDTGVEYYAMANIILRQKPSAGGKIVGTVQRGSKVVVYDQERLYSHMKVGDLVGWGNKRLLSKNRPPPKKNTPASSTPATSQKPKPVPLVQPNRSRSCCKVCRTGKACGDSCISRSYTCRKPPGCACNG